MQPSGCAPLQTRRTLAVPFPVAVVVRSTPAQQILVFSNSRDALFSTGSGARSDVFELLSNEDGSFSLGAKALELRQLDPSGELQPYNCQVALQRAVWCPHTHAVYFVEGRALMRLSNDNVVSRVAGDREHCDFVDGRGSAARFRLPQSLAADGRGGLLVADGGSVRRVQLPESDAPPGTEASVSTVYGGPSGAGVVDIAFDSLTGTAYAATISAIYRLPTDGSPPVRLAGSETAPGGSSFAALARTTTPAHLDRGAGGGAGAGQGDYLRAAVHAAGLGRGSSWPVFGGASVAAAGAAAAAAAAAAVGAGAALGNPAAAAAGAAAGSPGGGPGGPRSAGPSSGSGCCFTGISGLVTDGEGRLVVADREHVVCLGTDGRSVESVVSVGKGDTSWGAVGCYPTLLPGGWLALCQYHDRRVLMLQMGGRGTPSWGSGGAATGEGVAGLVADFGALLSRADTDAAADVTLVVGGRPFRAHRLILAARCEYFRRLFAGGFMDSASGEVIMQDADADAFAHLLRHIYTGDMGFPAHLLRPVAELADRLLLPGAARTAQKRLLAGTCSARVLDDLQWAHHMGFADLAASLKEWYMEHQEEVLAKDPDSVKQLFVRSPDLMFELHCATVARQRGGKGR